MKNTFTITLIFLFSLFANGLKAQLLSPTGNLTVPRHGHGSVLLNDGRVLAFGGNNANLMSFQAYKSSELYSSGSWTSAANMNAERSNPLYVSFSNGNVMVIGGEDVNFTELATCEIYNAATGVWTNIGSMNTPRAQTRAILLNNGKVLAIGSKYGTTCELYDPTSSSWTATGSLSTLRQSNFDATKLPDGNVLVTGGNSTTAEIYNVSTGTWSNVSNLMTESRAGSTAILMSNGKVLITGGNFTKTSEVFDPANKTFTPAGNMQQYASDCKMINLLNGNVLIYGIGDLFSTDRKSLQVFNPTSNSWSLAGPVGPTITPANGYTVHRLQNGKILYVGGNFSTGNGANNQCFLVDENAIVTSIKRNMDNLSIEVFPNPASQYINVKLNSNGALEYKITNIIGKTIMTGKLYNDQNFIPVDHLNNGTYFLEIIGENNAVIKFLKQ